MTLTHTWVTRYERVTYALDLAPILARFPAARPQSIVDVQAVATGLDAVRVTLRYSNDWLAIGSVSLDEYGEASTTLTIRDREGHFHFGFPATDCTLADVEPLIAAIGVTVLTMDLTAADKEEGPDGQSS